MSLIDVLIQTDFAGLANMIASLGVDPAADRAAEAAVGGMAPSIAGLAASVAAGLLAVGLGAVGLAGVSARRRKRRMIRRSAVARRARRRQVQAWDDDLAAEAREAERIWEAHFWEGAAFWDMRQDRPAPDGAQAGSVSCVSQGGVPAGRGDAPPTQGGKVIPLTSRH